MTINPFDGRTEMTAAEYVAIVGSNEEPSRARHDAPGRTFAPKLRESAFRDAVVALARYRGWRVMWTWNSRHSPKGWPDLFLVRNGRAIAAELKIPPRKPTQEQWDWLKDLALCGIETYVWVPDDWASIERILA